MTNIFFHKVGGGGGVVVVIGRYRCCEFEMPSPRYSVTKPALKLPPIISVAVARHLQKVQTSLLPSVGRLIDGLYGGDGVDNSSGEGDGIKRLPVIGRDHLLAEGTYRLGSLL